MLRRMINAHSQIAMTPETHWIPYLYKHKIGITEDGLVSRDICDVVSRQARFKDLELDLQDVLGLFANCYSMPYAEFVSGVFDLYGASRGKMLVGDKTPTYALEVSVLHALWPTAKFVHIIRDGRDVSLSLQAKSQVFKLNRHLRTWNEDPAMTSAMLWNWMVRRGRKDGRVLGANFYYEVRYESLVSQPEPECRRLSEFLGLRFEAGMLEFHRAEAQLDAGLDAARASLPVTSGLRDWQCEMSMDDVERFEAMSGDTLDELGYRRAVPVPRVDLQERAVELRGVFREDIAGR
jgi:hypothetical protein